MRSKFLNQIKYGADLTTATEKKGDSGAFIVIGGTAATAIKLQHCDTSDGTYEDFATLVAGADAGSDTNECVELDVSGAKKYLKVTGATTAVVVFGDLRFDPPSA